VGETLQVSNFNQTSFLCFLSSMLTDLLSLIKMKYDARVLLGKPYNLHHLSE